MIRGGRKATLKSASVCEFGGGEIKRRLSNYRTKSIKEKL